MVPGYPSPTEHPVVDLSSYLSEDSVLYYAPNVSCSDEVNSIMGAVKQHVGERARFIVGLFSVEDLAEAYATSLSGNSSSHSTFFAVQAFS